eukprot:1084727-Rhodomonas_salina.2
MPGADVRHAPARSKCQKLLWSEAQTTTHSHARWVQKRTEDETERRQTGCRGARGAVGQRRKHGPGLRAYRDTDANPDLGS